MTIAPEQSNEGQHSLPALRDLQARLQWVCWRKEERKGKLTKVPYNPQTDQRAASHNPQTWSSYQQAYATWKKRSQHYDGIGYMFQRDITGVDLDHCIDAEGNLEAWASDI